MTGINHALTGALVASAIKQPALALPLAFLSHFVIDALPHWNYRIGNLKKRHMAMAIDLIASLLLLVILSQTVNADAWVVFAGGILGILPDTMWLPYFLTGKPSAINKPKNPLHQFRRFHFWIQWSETKKGAAVEAVWFVMCLLLIYQI